jgi:hypothetical protein
MPIQNGFFLPKFVAKKERNFSSEYLLIKKLIIMTWIVVLGMLGKWQKQGHKQILIHILNL